MSKRIPLTQSQLGIFLASQGAKAGESYNLPFLCPLGFGIDPDRLADAIKDAVHAHPYIFSRIVMDEEGIPCIEERRDEEFEIKVEDAASRNEIMNLITCPDSDGVRRIKPFYLLKERLFRIRIFKTLEGVYLFSDFHHIIFDGTSHGVLLRDIEQAYEGHDVKTEEWSCMDVAGQESALRKSDVFSEELEWYREHFSVDDFSHMPGEIYADVIGKEPQDFHKIRVPMTVNEDKLDAACKSLEVGKAAMFQAAFGYVLAEYNHSREATFTTGFHGRTQENEKRTIDMMMRTIPVRISYKEGRSIKDLLKNVQELNSDIRKRRSVSLIDLNKALGWTGRISFVYQGEITSPKLNICGHTSEMEDLREHEPGLVFTMEILHKAGGYEAHVSWPANLLDEDFIRRFISQVDRVAAKLCHVRNTEDIELLTDAEKEEMIRSSRGERLDIDRSKTVTDLICEQSLRTPDALAVSDGNKELTYKELTGSGDILADALIKAGVTDNDFVAVLLDRSILFPVAVMGIHKAGAAYLPLDPEYPADRLEYMLSDSRAKVLVTSHADLDDRKDIEKLKTDTVIYLDDIDPASAASAINRSKPDGLAYMIYTSGTTGMPKGVMLHHAGLLNQVKGLVWMFGLTEKDRVGSHFSFSFDAHTRDIYAVLTVGGSLFIMRSDIRKDIKSVEGFMKEHELTDIGFTTSMGVILLSQCKYLPERISLGGEALSGISSDKAEIYNMYGPTECTNGNLWYRLEKGRTYSTVPLGHPVPNMWGFVTDRFGHLVPDGIPGELCMAGIQVGCGYLNQPEKTKEVFLDCPFADKDDDGKRIRMYKTGDLVYRNTAGELIYKGRIDEQVKLHGYRIELSEIENRAGAVAGIDECAAAVVQVGKVKHLCLYYTSKAPIPPEADSIRAALQNTSLAAYMIPDVYTYMEELKRTPSGKVDRRNLPAPDVSKMSKNIIQPRTVSEERLYYAISKVLGTKDFGVNSDLVELGLTSLDAIAVSAEAQKYEVLVKAMDILKLRTIENILNNRKNICGWVEGGPDENKPVMVVMYGLNSVSRMGELINILSEDFSVLTIENIMDHYRFIFIDETITDMAAFYCEMIDYFLPENMQIFGFFGHSFGGELAYRTAAYWTEHYMKDEKAHLPHVYMLDTGYFQQSKEEARETVENLKKMESRFTKDTEDYRYYIEERDFGTVAVTSSASAPMPSYDGPVTLFSVKVTPLLEKLMNPEQLDNYRKTGMSPHEFLWNNNLKNLSIIRMEGNHEDLQNAKYAPVYMKVLKEDKKKG